MSIGTTLALEAAARANRIGCCFSTQAGEMPTPAEVNRLLTEALDKVKAGNPSSAARVKAIEELTALALFARLLESENV